MKCLGRLKKGMVILPYNCNLQTTDMRRLILCTGNSCRSQMAEGFLKSFDKSGEVFSAGTNPSSQVHAKAIEVMREVNIDISSGFPKKVDRFINSDFDYMEKIRGN